ncbi:MAG: CRTAC1 family protein, partial [Planctomycetes bacterium]|nr:CRTAC1 family protein [Planctomycetota bacterium]
LRKEGGAEGARQLLDRFRALQDAEAGELSGMKYGEMGRYASVVRAFEGTAAAPDLAQPPALRDRAPLAGLDRSAAGEPGWPGSTPGAGAAAFGPGAAVADVDGDRDLDLFLPATGEGGRGTLYLNERGHFAAVADCGVDGRGAIGAFFGDYDQDGDPDLFLSRAGPDRLYRNDGGGAFTDVTAASGVAGGDWTSVGATWADTDHDGDLDLAVARFGPADASRRGAPNALWRNNGDGSFLDVAPGAGIDGGDRATLAVAFADLDDDRDLDLLFLHHGADNQVFLNDRVGRYRDAGDRFPALAGAGDCDGLVSGDLDLDGREDLLLLRGADAPLLLLQGRRGSYQPNSRFSAALDAFRGAAGALLGDLDLDGDLDLVLLDAGSANGHGHWILSGDGDGGLHPPVPLGDRAPRPRSRGAVAADLDGDGSLELLVARAGAAPQLWSAPPVPGRRWLQVLPSQPDADSGWWAEPDAVGLLVELKTGQRSQLRRLESSTGYLGSAPRRLHFGLGAATEADYVRLSWPDAVLQSELEVPAGQLWQITKIERKPSSCPILFSWDGERFAFVTDFLGVGGLGFFAAPGEYAPPDPTEDVRIPPELVRPRGGRYLLRVTEPLEEVSYLDELHLRVYDHPAEWEVHPDERFTGTAPFPTGEAYAFAAPIHPESARSDRGRDLLEDLRHVDRRYAAPPPDPRFPGYARDHWLELDFGERLRRRDPARRLVLVLHGWVEYTYSHVNYAAWQAGVAMRSPWIELPDGAGGWSPASPEMGFPAGLPRVMTVDISELPLQTDGRLRIRTNMEVSWDQIYAAEDLSAGGLVRHELHPTAAVLRPLGYPREYSPDGSDPTVYDYHRLDLGVPFKNMRGIFTAHGDVRELLRRVDDRFVILARGDEIALEFDATGLPPLPEGWSRTLVLHADGYCKDMDLYTAYPDTIEPLPFHGMANYPPEPAAAAGK